MDGKILEPEFSRITFSDSEQKENTCLFLCSENVLLMTHVARP